MLSKNGRARRLTSWGWRIATAAVLVTAVPALTTMTVSQSASAAVRAQHAPLPGAPANKRVKLSKARPVPAVKKRAPYAKFDPAGHAALPAASSTTVSLGKGTRTRAGSSPISLTVPTGGTVQVTTADQKTAVAAGVHGVLFGLKGAAGPVGVDVDPSTFRNAYGGDYAARLHLVSMPACALTTPSRPECQTQTPVPAAVATPLSARVTASATGTTVLAATSTVAGPTGDYTATSLSPGGSWAGGGNSGAFTYSYPIPLPPGVSATMPSFSLGYDSSSQDARTEGTNDQSSWLGDGWSSSENFVERIYKTCSEVSGSGAPQYDGDSCWAGQMLTLSLNGSSTSIVYDTTDAAHPVFRPVSDSSTIKIEDASTATNGTKNGEFFKVTENGVQYFFGLDRLPGWSAGKEETNSVYTVPVYKAHAGVSACPDSTTFADTACTLGYRFNLDYVVDTKNNAVAYYYAPETGYYGSNMKNTAVPYVRAGTLKRIDYGMTASTVYSATAPVRVSFTTDERCEAGNPVGNTCDPGDFTESHPAYWPDTPIDMNCAEKSTSCAIHGPTFWSRRRLTSIATDMQVDGVTKPVDRWDFAEHFPDGGDHAPTLWLDSIKHTGLDRLGGATSDASTPAVTFTPAQLPNRVGTVPSLPRMYHNRIGTVVTETGAETDIDYATPNCSTAPASDLTDVNDTKAQAFAAANTTGCFPVYWTPVGQPRPMIDWFYTHPVSRVTSYDGHNHYQDGTSPRLVTEYAYVGSPGWHYDDNELVKAKNRTWGQFRGYPEVDITTGDPSVFHYTNQGKVFDQKTLTKTYYFLGMNGDTQPGGKTRPAINRTSQDTTVSVADANALAGRQFESDTWTGVGGTVDSAVITVPTILGPTATRARTGLTALTAQMVRTAKVFTRNAVSYGTRKTETDSFYNTALGQSTTGMLVQSDDRGETGAAGNVAHCTFTRYLDGTVASQVEPTETIVTDQDCTTAGAAIAGNLLSDTRTSLDLHPFAYNGDGQTNVQKPTAGNPTTVQVASVVSGVTVSAWVTESTATFDDYGRPVSAVRTPNSKALDAATSIAQAVYTRRSPSTGAVPTSVTTVTQVTPGTDCSAVTVSSKDCMVTTVTMDPARGQPLGQTDVAGKVTSVSYDALGRTTAVWQPNKSKALQAAPNQTFAYAVSATAPTVVTSKSLLDNEVAGAADAYATSEVLYDAFQRPLETQATGENGSVTVTDTQYDTHGWTVLTNNGYAITGTPGTGLVSDHLSQVSIPQTTVTDHDAMGRPTLVTEEHVGVKTRMTRTAYTGDKTTVVPPVGGVSATTVVDARGQTRRLDQYTVAPTLTGSATQGFTAAGGASQSITYDYTSAGKQSKVTGPDASVWSYGYDLLGRQTSHTDPDTGTSSAKYDDANNVIATRDARAIELDYTYDLLGRKLTGVDKTKSFFKFASWTYDTLQIGKQTSATRYVPGVTGDYTVTTTGFSTLGNPLGSTLTLPTAELPLPASYTTTMAYTRNNELPEQQTDPAVNGLPGETITYGHDALGAPTSTAGADLYSSGSIYTDFGQLSKRTMGDSANEAEAVYAYDEETLRLTGRQVFRSQGIGPLVDDTAYTYDEAGNPLSSVDRQLESGNIVTDTQCYRYNGLDRLTDAWTTNNACTAGPSATTVSNTAGSYWQSFGYDLVGDRTQSVDHSTNGGANLTTTYVNGCTTGCNKTGAQPHALTSTTGSTDPTKFVYDVDGNLLTRTPTKAAAQNLKWDDEGNLAEVDTTGPAPTTTTYLYDADGNQLIRRDPGKTTLFAGDTEIVINTAGTTPVALGAVRTYSCGGAAVAVRSTLPGGGTDYLFDDPHGTSTLAMDTTTQTLSRRQYKPYGEDRTTANPTAWPDLTHGYLGKSTDAATGYTDLGARKFDPSLGRFISADPILQTTDPNQIGGYTYSGDNPISGSDPTGLSGDTGNGSGNGVRFNPTTGHVLDPGNGDNHTGTATGGITNNDDDSSDDNPVPVSDNGNGSSNIGNINVSNQQVKNVDKYGQMVSTSYVYLMTEQKGFAALSSGHRLLWAMALACDNKAAICTAEFNHEIQQAVAHRAFADACGGNDNDCYKSYTKYEKLLGNAIAFTLTYGAEAGGPRAAAAAETVSGVSIGAMEAGGEACLNSFTPATLVRMGDAAGTTKPIRDIKVGDVVLAMDLSTGETVAKTVTALHDNLDTDLADLTVIDDHGVRSTIHTTDEHRFWDVSTASWTTTARLLPGDRLQSPHSELARVVKVRSFTHPQHMLNLTVADLHTYFVLVGDTPVLVHNCGEEDDFWIEDHVEPRHVTGGAENAADKSTFSPELSDRESLLNLASQSKRFVGQVQEATGNVRWVINTGRNMGTDQNGLPTTMLTIVRRPAGQWDAGNLVTMHPGLPRDLTGPFAQ